MDNEGNRHVHIEFSANKNNIIMHILDADICVTEKELETNVCEDKDSSPGNEEDQFEFLDDDNIYLQIQQHSDFDYVDNKDITNIPNSINQSNLQRNITESVHIDK